MKNHFSGVCRLLEHARDIKAPVKFNNAPPDKKRSKRKKAKSLLHHVIFFFSFVTCWILLAVGNKAAHTWTREIVSALGSTS